jgi:hypothetical protein
MQKKRDELLDYIVIVLEKLGGELIISQKEIDDCRSKNLQVVNGSRGEGVKLSILDGTKEYNPPVTSFGYDGRMQSWESTDAELTRRLTEQYSIPSLGHDKN